MQSLWKKLTELTVTRRLKLPSGQVIDNNRLAVVTAAAIILNADTHGDKPIVLNRVGGIAVTLPAATGSGVKFDFTIGATYTSSGTIKVANATDVMQGFAIQSQDAGATLQMFETAASSDTITFDGSTTGGLVGDRVELMDMLPGFWSVRVTGAATGAEATPFSATV